MKCYVTLFSLVVFSADGFWFHHHSLGSHPAQTFGDSALNIHSNFRGGDVADTEPTKERDGLEEIRLPENNESTTSRELAHLLPKCKVGVT